MLLSGKGKYAVAAGLSLSVLAGLALWHYALSPPSNTIISEPDSHSLTTISAPMKKDLAEPTKPSKDGFDWQEEGASQQPTLSPNGYLARIELNSPQELKQALLRAEKLYLDGQVSDQTEPPAFILHGPEVAVFFKENYEAHKSLVDLAARLSAFKVLDVRVCRTRMGVLGREDDVLFPFVGTVPFGPAEINRLLNEQNYVYF